MPRQLDGHREYRPPAKPRRAFDESVSERSRSRAVGASSDQAPVVEGVRITNASRAIPGEDGVTKLDVVRYYQSVAPALLSEIAYRPLSLIRCPGGDFGRCFFRRHPDDDREPRDASTDVPYVRITT